MMIRADINTMTSSVTVFYSHDHTHTSVGSAGEVKSGYYQYVSLDFGRLPQGAVQALIHHHYGVRSRALPFGLRSFRNQITADMATIWTMYGNYQSEPSPKHTHTHTHPLDTGNEASTFLMIMTYLTMDILCD